MSILYLEHKNFLIVKIATRITDCTEDRDVMLQSARTPPSEGQLMMLTKSNLNLLLSPWHSGYSISSQSKPYLVAYARRHWALVVDAHTKRYNEHREPEKRLKCVFGNTIPDVDEADEGEGEEEETCEQDPEVEVEVPYDTKVEIEC